MTNKIAIVLALIIIAVFLADRVLFGGGLPVFLGRKIVDLSEYIAFWR
ncbi:hypothetical protein [Aliiroseovarius subalbicans]|nr:hypothetical protein [Aliiroseovarius subalbicans]MCI2398812.1 hypothetical protein [Aliiroseovarius subalbicans]